VSRGGWLLAGVVLLVSPLRASQPDSAPAITLVEALQLAARLDPGYVRSLGLVENAAWSRRAAMSALVLPSVSTSADITRFSVDQFNVGTGAPARTSAVTRIDGRFEVFAGFRKVGELRRASAELESAEAGLVQQRYLTALLTEAAFYSVLGGRELLEVARERVRRAEEGLVVARARVVSGAAVQSDSLQLLLELDRARVGLLQEESGLRVARLQLGRRVGRPGGVDAVTLDSTRAPDLPLSLEEAIAHVLDQGPEYRAARANERVAEAALRIRQGFYLPTAVLSGNNVAFGDAYLSRGLTRSSITFSVSFPLWDNAQRELILTRARTAREAARAARELAGTIGERSGLPVALWDERFSTARALRAVHALGGSTRGRKAEVDALAATVLLQHFLDSRRGSAT